MKTTLLKKFRKNYNYVFKTYENSPFYSEILVYNNDKSEVFSTSIENIGNLLENDLKLISWQFYIIII